MEIWAVKGLIHKDKTTAQQQQLRHVPSVHKVSHLSLSSLHELVSPSCKDKEGKQMMLVQSHSFSSKSCGLWTQLVFVTLPLTINETLKWLSLLPTSSRNNSGGDTVSFPLPTSWDLDPYAYLSGTNLALNKHNKQTVQFSCFCFLFLRWTGALVHQWYNC